MYILYHITRSEATINVLESSNFNCAPWAHETMGTFPGGTVRFSFGWFNTHEEINYTLTALEEIIND